MGFWTIQYRQDMDDDYTVVEATGQAGVPPFLEQISTDQFVLLELYATHSDEPEITFYKPLQTREWTRLEQE